MNILEKSNDLLEDYKELCEFFNVEQKPMDDFREHYNELQNQLYDQDTIKLQDNKHENDSNNPL